LKRILICIILLTFLTGCSAFSDYIEPENRVMVSAFGLDYIDNEILVTAECIDINTTNNNDSYNIMVLTASGETLQKAIAKLNAKIDGKLFLNQCPVLLLGEGLNLSFFEDVFEIAVNKQTLPLGIHIVCCEDAQKTISANADKKPAGYQLMSLLHFGKNTVGITDDDTLVVILNSIGKGNLSSKLPRIDYLESYEIIGCRYFIKDSYSDFDILNAQLLYLINNDLMPSKIIVQNEVLDYIKSNIINDEIIITIKNYEKLKFIKQIEAELENRISLISDKKYKVKLKGVK